MRISDWSSDVCSSDLWGVPELADYIGMVWFREDVTVSAAQARQQAVLAIGPVDDADRTWVNGVAVGGNGNPGEPRTYLVPVGTLVAGRNTITVNADNVYAKGGMSGPAEAMRLLFADGRSEEHTSELQSLMRNSHAVFCLKKKN